jgi:hypothetical protein
MRDMNEYAESLLPYYGVKETIAEAPAGASYNTILALAQRRFQDFTVGGYATCVADRADEWLRVQRMAALRAA